jgi:hypothetical protein
MAERCSQHGIIGVNDDTNKDNTTIAMTAVTATTATRAGVSSKVVLASIVPASSTSLESPVGSSLV